MLNKPSLQEIFKKAAETLTSLLKDEGIGFRAFTHPHLPHFSHLPRSEREVIVQHLSDYTKLCLDIRHAFGSMKNNKQLTIAALEQWNLSIDLESLELIEQDHVIEIYDLGERQIFRSLRYFELTSYTIEEIYCRRWDEIYHRDPEIEKTMRSLIAELMSQNNMKPRKTHLPRHQVREIASLEKLTWMVETKWLIPIMRNGALIAVMVLHKAT